MPFFSVVIPLYNKAAHIKSTLKSVLDQNFDDFEIIIVDDGSTDKSLEKVKTIQDERIKLFVQENSGASAARNYGVEKSQGEHIALLDADDVWEKNHLEEHYKSIQKFPEAALYCNAYKLKLAGGFTHKATYNIPQKEQISLVPDYFEASIIHPLANTNAVAFKKNDFQELGGFKPDVFSGQDIDLWIRFGLNKTVVFNSTITNSYDKTIENSLSKGNYRKSKYELFNAYSKEETMNPSLKRYMDLNRYSLAIQCKYFDDEQIVKRLKKEINAGSLTGKQKFLLNMPSWMIRKLKKLHSFLIKRSIYLTAFK